MKVVYAFKEITSTSFTWTFLFKESQYRFIIDKQLYLVFLKNFLVVNRNFCILTALWYRKWNLIGHVTASLVTDQCLLVYHETTRGTREKLNLVFSTKSPPIQHVICLNSFHYISRTFSHNFVLLFKGFMEGMIMFFSCKVQLNNSTMSKSDLLFCREKLANRSQFSEK